MSKEGAPDLAEGSPDAQEAQLRRTGRRWRTVLRLVFVSLAVLVWLAFAESTSHERRLTLAAVAERDANLASAVEHYTVRVLRTARAVHRLVGGLLARSGSEDEAVLMLADRLRANDIFQELGLCLPDGRVLPPPAPGARLTAAVCAQMLAHSGSGPEVDVLPPIGPAGAVLVPLTLSLEDDRGRRLALAVALPSVETMLGSMQSTVLRDDTAVLLAGADGLPRAAWRSQVGHVHDPADFAAYADLLRARGGRAVIGGGEYLVSSRALPQARLRIQVATDSADALADFHERSRQLLGLCVLLTIGLAAVYRLLARMHTESLVRARALDRARAQLQAVNDRLDTQVQERTAQLEQAYRDLEIFSYTVAHDVRAPLASIAGFAGALEPAVAQSPDPKHLHYLKRIQANVTHMEELTRHLLELGRLTRAPLVPEIVDLGALALEAVARLRETDPGRRVQVSVQPDLLTRGDRALLRQVMENLLGNAWKFTSRRPTAQIALGRKLDHPAGDEDVFFVADDGEGFDSEQAPGLFQPFRRMHGAEQFPGTGVGLAAVQRILALHGGRVWCHSQPGAGARFFFSLPTVGPAGT